MRHQSDLLISVSAPQPAAGLELLDASPPATEPAGDGLVTTFSYVMAAFALGELQPGALRVSWLRSDGTAGSVEVAAPALRVRSTLSAGDTQLRPLKPQAAIAGAPPPWQRPATAVAGGALFALFAGAAWLMVVRRRRPEPEAIDAPVAGPEERARLQLDRLAAARMLGERDFERYYGTISAVVRGYLQDRFGFRATALTASELQSRMTDQGVERWQARLVSGLLDRCDAAVYAHRHPDPASADHDLTAAYEIVELSTPRSPAARS